MLFDGKGISCPVTACINTVNAAEHAEQCEHRRHLPVALAKQMLCEKQDCPLLERKGMLVPRVIGIRNIQGSNRLVYKRLKASHCMPDPQGYSLLVSAPVPPLFGIIFFVLLNNLVKLPGYVPDFFCRNLHARNRTERYLRISIDILWVIAYAAKSRGY